GVKTTFLLLSDTYAKNGVAVPDLPVDVAIHYGDLTDGSKIHEFETTLTLLRSIEAPLKIVIAGNHNFTLDKPVYREKADTTRRLFSIIPELMRKEYGNPGNIYRLISQEPEGIHFLNKGTYYFRLSNSTDLTIYISPFTPSIEADWGFYKVDVVITYGPPKGQLFAARGMEPSENPSHFTDIDNSTSSVIETLVIIEPR
ncbi:hypothetical protein B0T24DRAFT_617166, partial [Lasiosphaeria ovina]